MLRGGSSQSRQSKRALKTKLTASSLEAKLAPQKVIILEKKFYDQLMQWITNESAEKPQNSINNSLLSSIKSKKEIKKGVDYEILNSNIYLDLIKIFPKSQKIEGSLTINPITKAETVLFNPISVNIQVPNAKRGSSRSVNRQPKSYDLDPNWKLGDFKQALCEQHNLEPSECSFYSRQTYSNDKLKDTMSIQDLQRRYRNGIELELKCDDTKTSTMKTIKTGTTTNTTNLVTRPKTRNPSVPRFQRQLETKQEVKISSIKTKNSSAITMKAFASSTSNVQNELEKDQYESFSSSMTTNSRKLYNHDDGFDVSNNEKSPQPSIFNANSKSIFLNKENSFKKPELGSKVSTFADSSEIVSTFSSSKHFPKPVGFCNLGNTCFFNAALQCLVRVQPLTDFILSSEFENQINIRNPKSSKGRIATAYRAFLEDLCASKSGYKDPSNLRSAFVSKFKRFANFGQHDSQELLCCLLDGIHEDLNQSSFAHGRNPPIPTTSNSDYWDVHLSKDASPVVDIFHGKLFSSITCPSCHRVESVHDPFMFLQLDIPRRFSAVKLSDCLQSFSERYTLDSDNKWKCSGCNQMVCATKEMGVDSCPKILLIHLKRFSGEGYFASKIDTKVDYPDELDSKTFTRKNSGIYRLIGAVFHGGGLGGGHYTAAALDPESKRWYNFNDSIATPIDSSGAHKGGAYILVYQRI